MLELSSKRIPQQLSTRQLHQLPHSMQQDGKRQIWARTYVSMPKAVPPFLPLLAPEG
jgi:hypothetical protein